MPSLVPPVVAPGTVAAAAQPAIPVDAELHLRRFEAGDVGAVEAAYADPDIQRWHRRRVEDPGEALDWVERTHEAWAGERAATWAVVGPGTAVLGRVTLYLRLPEGDGEISSWVLPGARSRGVASRSVRAVTGWAHAVAGLHRVELRHSVHNRASCRVAVKAGFRPEGTLRGALLHEDGWHDVHLHAHVVGGPVPPPVRGGPPSLRPRGGS